MIKIGGEFYCERWSANGVRLGTYYAKNGVTNAALTNLLDVYCRQQANSTWRLGLIDNDAFDELDEDDTIASHAGWTEVTAYSEGSRPLWAPGASADQTIINPSSVQFTMTATKTIAGIFVVNEGTKGGTTGLMLSTGLLDATALMQTGEALKIFYRLSAEGR